MKVIEVRPSKKFKGAWVVFEAPGVEPAFAAPDAKSKATDYACGRFGGSSGEVHVQTPAAKPKRTRFWGCRAPNKGSMMRPGMKAAVVLLASNPSKPQLQHRFAPALNPLARANVLQTA